MSSYSQLFSPGKIGTMEMKNRLVMAPMATNYATIHGEASDIMVDYYRERARGGVGLIIVEAACVDSPVGGDGVNQLNIDHPQYLPGLQRLAEEIKMYGARAFLQLFHAGRQGSSFLNGGHQIVAPSALACPMVKELPRELTIAEIHILRDKFVTAAYYAKLAGFDGVELHAAHGYLLNQFLSPHSNQRQDDFGGSLENRMRFLLEIVSSIKKIMPRFLLSVRLNIDDFVSGGLQMDESILISQALQAAGTDIIHCSSGTYASGLKSIEPASYAEGWRIYLAAAVKAAVNIPVIGGGMVRDPQMADQIIATGQADFVFLGRPLLADPHWPQKVLQGRVEEIRPCINCNHCIGHNFKGLAVRCTVNPYTGREKYLTQNQPLDKQLQAVVVGGGPAGMQAALALHKKGIQVQLYEQEDQLGGGLNLAHLPPYKERILLLRDYMIRKFEKSQVKLVLNHSFSPTDLEEIKPDILVIATGSTAIIPEAAGAEKEFSWEATQVLKANVDWSELRVAIIGGGSTGCELAEYLALQNNQVTIIEQDTILARGMEKKNRRDLLNRLAARSVQRKTGKYFKGVNAARLVIQDQAGQEEEIMADRLVWAVGARSNDRLYHAAMDHVRWLFLIGDASEVRGFAEAISEGEAVAGYICEND